jgi:diacylglycerol kinase (ATP)
VNFKKRLESFGFAFKGIATLIRTQENAQIHLFAVFIATILGFLLKISTSEWCFIIFAFSMVLAAEAFNTAIEFIVDLVSPNYHPLAGKAKDVAAAAVLFVAFSAAIVGMIIFLPKFWYLIQKYFF